MGESGLRLSVIQMAIHQVTIGELNCFWLCGAAALHHLRTSGVEVTPGWRIKRGGDISRQHDSFFTFFGVQFRFGGSQRLGVGMSRFLIQDFRGSDLDDFPQVHDRSPSGKVLYDVQIMRNK